MKSLVSTRFGVPAEMCIEERSKPTFRNGYSVVKMHAATVNPLSDQVRSGIVEFAKAPLVLSNDGSGIVEESECYARGTRVAIYGGANLGISEDGLQQQWALVENKRLLELPKELSLNQGAALPINYVTAYQALTRVGCVQKGHTVLISGATGSVGHALIQLTNALGGKAIAVVSSAAKVSLAYDSGAHAVIDLSTQNLKTQVMNLTNNHGADLAFDPVGGELMGLLLSALRIRGSVISIGFVGGGNSSVDVADIVIKEKKILGYDAWLETDEDVSKAMDNLRMFITEGKIAPRIDSTFPIEKYSEAYERLNSRKATGTILLELNPASCN